MLEKRKNEAKKEEQRKRIDETDLISLLENLGKEISQVAKAILDKPILIEPGQGWGTPFVTIGPCDGSCNSPLHKCFIVILFEGELAFHCDYEDLIAFSKFTDFIRLGELAFIEDEKEALTEALVEQGIQIVMIEPEEVNDYLSEHPELLDEPNGSVLAVAAVGEMRKKRISEARDD